MSAAGFELRTPSTQKKIEKEATDRKQQSKTGETTDHADADGHEKHEEDDRECFVCDNPPEHWCLSRSNDVTEYKALQNPKKVDNELRALFLGRFNPRDAVASWDKDIYRVCDETSHSGVR